MKDGVNRFFSVTSGAGTAAWGFTELTGEQIFASSVGTPGVVPILAAGAITAWGVSSVLSGFGVLSPIKETACSIGGD